MPKYKLPNDGSGISWEMEDVVGEPGKWIIKTEENTDPLFEFNKKIRNNGYEGNLTFGRHVASIPATYWNRWWKQYPCLRNGKRDPDYEKTLHMLIMTHPEVKLTEDHLGKDASRKNHGSIIVR